MVGTDPDRQRFALGSNPHTDWGFLTLIAEDGPALELQSTEGTSWITTHIPPDSLLVLMGDVASILSNRKIRSPWHRVRLPSERRHSLVFFMYPAEDTILSIPSDPRDLSLFANQSSEGQSTGPTYPKESFVFGPLLLDKWAQVARR